MAALALAIAGSERADARGVWCAGDPAIIVNGSVVDVNVNIPLERLADVKDVDIVFHVPSNATVLATVNDSLVFKANIRVVKDLAPTRGLLNTPVQVDITVNHRGTPFAFGATTIATGAGTRLWVDGNTTKTLRVSAVGLLALRLF
ncbi:hypothetical protein AYO38_01300 [bacterium SCGC AG-212-C10]|nr:hypothetical protein AYO38_01300 [bacterium SCGC AG-212-C10]